MLSRKGLGAAALVLLLSAPASALAQVTLSEIRIDQSGTDNDEYFELAGAGGASLTGLTYLVIGDGTGGSGVIEEVTDLSGQTMPAGGYFVAAESTFTLGSADLTTTLNFENSDNVTHLVVSGFTGADGDDLDSDDDGVLDTTPWTAVVDCVGLVETVGSGDQVYCADTVGPDGTYVPGHVFDCSGSWQIGAFSPVGTDDTPGAANSCGAGPATDVVINEVDADMAGTETTELVELYDGGVGSTALDGLVVVLYNGNGDTSYDAFDLDGYSTDGSGYFVIGGTGVAGADLTVAASYWLQNGADAVALYAGDGADFPNGSAVTTTNLVDAVVYDTNDADDAGLLVLLNPGEPQVNEDAGGNKDSESSQRCPNGGGGQRNTSPFIAAGPTPGAANACPLPSVVVNEVDYDQSGTDTAEFVELKNTGGSSVNLDSLAIEIVNGSGGGATVARTIDLPDVDLAAGDYYVVCGNAATVPNCDLDVTPDTNLIQNGAPDAVALVQGGTVVDTVSYEGDTGAPYTEGSGSGLADLTSVDFAGISRYPDGTDTDVNNVDFSLRCITPGETNAAATSGCVPPPSATLTIPEIQGSGLASTHDGESVETLDNVVTAVGPNGFFIQDPVGDLDPQTSDGIYVFTGGPPVVTVGDQVDVVGLVDEFFDLTELGGPATFTVDSSANPLPLPVVLDATTPSPDQPQPANEMERYEGMLVRFQNGVATGPSDKYGDVAVVAKSARVFREPGIEFPGIGGLPVWDGNPEVFEVDPDGLGGPDLAIDAGTPIIDAIGPLTYSFGDYQLLPTTLVLGAPPVLPMAVRAPEAGELTIASLNLYRLFDDVDDPPSLNVDGATRDDTVVGTAEYLRRRAKLARYVVDVLRGPDVLGVEEAEKLGVLQDLAADIAALDPSLAYTAYLVEGNDIGTIDVGLLVRDTVAVDGVTQLGATEHLTYDGSPLHDRPPLLLEGRYLANGVPYAFKVLVVHARSLGGIEDPVDGDRVRHKRLEQAQSIAQMVQNEQDADPSVRLVVVGDFNAFEVVDGYVDLVGQIKGSFDPAQNLLSGPDLVDPDLTDQVLGLGAGDRYSFVYRGSAQVLDHALTSSGIATWLRGMAYGRGNADAAASLIDDDSTALRSSDHDGLVLYVMTDRDGDGVPDDVDANPDGIGAVPTLTPLGVGLLAGLLAMLGVAALRRA